MHKGLRQSLYSLLALAVVILACIPAFTQTITGSITGLVTDPSGAVVAGAKVTATNVLTGVVTPTVTNPSGIYSLRFLQIGQYKIRVESSSFAPESTSAFALEVDQEAKVNIVLKVGSSRQQRCRHRCRSDSEYGECNYRRYHNRRNCHGSSRCRLATSRR